MPGSALIAHGWAAQNPGAMSLTPAQGLGGVARVAQTQVVVSPKDVVPPGRRPELFFSARGAPRHPLGTKPGEARSQREPHAS